MEISKALRNSGKRAVPVFHSFCRGRGCCSGGNLCCCEKALEFIREHYEAPISLQDAADAAEVNPAYLSYLFKQEMKIGFPIMCRSFGSTMQRSFFQRRTVKLRMWRCVPVLEIIIIFQDI